MSTESPPTDPDQAGASHDPRGCYYAVTSLVYDGRGNVADVVRQDGRAPATTSAAARRFRWEHLLEKRLFALTADGKTEYRRDSLTRYLVVEPDPTTGTIKPVLKWGRPVYLLVCREEREARGAGQS
ncbi:MAG: hypothetical protein ACLQVF_22550 [Isosphaeraceae bacterium]